MSDIPQYKFDQLDANVINDIATYGWSDMGIFPVDEGNPLPFNYSVGFISSYQHPEVIVMGIANEQGHGALSVVAAAVSEGTRYTAGQYYDDILEGYQVAFVDVLDVLGDYPLTMAAHLQEDVTAVQLVWPDANGRFPWHDDMDPVMKSRQELLGPWTGE